MRVRCEEAEVEEEAVGVEAGETFERHLEVGQTG